MFVLEIEKKPKRFFEPFFPAISQRVESCGWQAQWPSLSL